MNDLDQVHLRYSRVIHKEKTQIPTAQDINVGRQLEKLSGNQPATFLSQMLKHKSMPYFWVAQSNSEVSYSTLQLNASWCPATGGLGMAWIVRSIELNCKALVPCECSEMSYNTSN